jgi:hypothetical protein
VVFREVLPSRNSLDDGEQSELSAHRGGTTPSVLQATQSNRSVGGECVEDSLGFAPTPPASENLLFDTTPSSKRFAWCATAILAEVGPAAMFKDEGVQFRHRRMVLA